MHLYRIVKSKYASQLDGYGASKVGGRWNPKGTAVIYTSMHRSLAVLEKVIQFAPITVPKGLVILTIGLPEACSRESLEIRTLPKNWRARPAPPETKEKGRDFVNRSASLLLVVPSAIIPEEHNVLINPAHPEFSGVKVISTKPFPSFS